MMTVEQTNIAAHLPAMAKSRGRAMAIACPRSGGGSGGGSGQYEQWTFERLNNEADLIMRGLSQTGIEPGMRTVLMVQPGLDFFALVFALFRLGAVPVLVDPGMGVKNLGVCLSEAKPQAFIGIPKAHLARKLLGWPKGGPSILVGPGLVRLLGMTTLQQVRRAGKRSDFNPPTVEADDTAAILFTSGSTGVPKGAVYSHGNFQAQIAALRGLYNIEPGEIDLCTFPLFALFAPALGMSSVIPDIDFTRPGRVNPANILGPVHKFGVTNMFGSPALIDRVGRAGGTLATLKRAVSAGAPVSPATIERFIKMMPAGAQLFTPYGATESLPICSIGSDEILGDTRALTDQGRGVCVGQPVQGVELSIITINDQPIAHWSDDLKVPAGEIGEIVVKGPMVTRSYYNRPQSTALAKIADADGAVRHRMGDVGYLDENGRLWFCGRKSHRVTIADETMFTVPCESIFNTHPDVYRSALVKVGESPVICIELEQGASRHGLTPQLLKLAQQHELTQPIQEVLYHRAFPVDIRHNAKIGRGQLARWAARKLS